MVAVGYISSVIIPFSIWKLGVQSLCPPRILVQPNPNLPWWTMCHCYWDSNYCLQPTKLHLHHVPLARKTESRASQGESTPSKLWLSVRGWHYSHDCALATGKEVCHSLTHLVWRRGPSRLWKGRLEAVQKCTPCLVFIRLSAHTFARVAHSWLLVFTQRKGGEESSR